LPSYIDCIIIARQQRRLPCEQTKETNMKRAVISGFVTCSLLFTLLGIFQFVRSRTTGEPGVDVPMPFFVIPVLALFAGLVGGAVAGVFYWYRQRGASTPTSSVSHELPAMTCPAPAVPDYQRTAPDKADREPPPLPAVAPTQAHTEASPIERIFFQSGDIKVTQASLVVGVQTYALHSLSSIGGVSIRPNRKWPIILMVGGIFSLFITTIIGIVWWLCQKCPQYSVVLSSSSGNQTAFTSTDPKLVADIVAAVGTAIGKVHAVGFGRFVKKYVPPITGGRYRGAGDLEVTPDGLEIRGRHVHSAGARWTVAVIVGVFTVYTACTVSGSMTSYTWVGIEGILLMLFLEYGWLKRKDILLPFSAIMTVSCDPARQLVAVEFGEYEWCSPAVLETPSYESLFRALQSGVSASKPAWDLGDIVRGGKTVESGVSASKPA